MELESRSHRSRLWGGEDTRAALPVPRPVPLGDEPLRRLPEQLAALIAEEPLGLGIDEYDRALLVDDHHRVRRRFEQRSKILLRERALCDVAHERHDGGLAPEADEGFGHQTDADLARLRAKASFDIANRPAGLGSATACPGRPQTERTRRLADDLLEHPVEVRQ